MKMRIMVSYLLLKQGMAREECMDIFTTMIEPRVSETDGVGHINNTTLPVWLEAGRLELFKLFTPDLNFKKWKMIILKTSVEYTAMMYFGQPVEIKCWIKKLGNSSIELYEEVWQKGIMCAKAETIYVNFDLEKQKSEPIPMNIRELLKQHMVEEIVE